APPIKTNLIEQILTQANGRKIIGLIGGQDKRKGSFTLFKIAKECKHKNWFFLFVGRFNSDKSDKELKKLKNLISKEKNLSNCFFHFHRIPNENEFNSLISICNVIFAVYHNFYCSSNIMTKAAIFKKPIIVNKYGLMAKRVKKYNTGIVCNEKNISDCIKAISEVLNDKQTIRNYSLYSNDHSQVKFISQIEYLINSNH
ncbi:MAG: glycosyltransferase, partial [Candidatus Muiribacteriota bacterium]